MGVTALEFIVLYKVVLTLSLGDEIFLDEVWTLIPVKVTVLFKYYAEQDG